MGILTILNLVTGITSVINVLIPEAIAIKNALTQSGVNFDVTVKTIEGDIVTTTGQTDADIAAWTAAHPA
jgi:hypothetical protein